MKSKKTFFKGNLVGILLLLPILYVSYVESLYFYYFYSADAERGSYKESLFFTTYDEKISSDDNTIKYTYGKFILAPKIISKEMSIGISGVDDLEPVFLKLDVAKNFDSLFAFKDKLANKISYMVSTPMNNAKHSVKIPSLSGSPSTYYSILDTPPQSADLLIKELREKVPDGLIKHGVHMKFKTKEYVQLRFNESLSANQLSEFISDYSSIKSGAVKHALKTHGWSDLSQLDSKEYSEILFIYNLEYDHVVLWAGQDKFWLNRKKNAVSYQGESKLFSKKVFQTEEKWFSSDAVKKAKRLDQKYAVVDKEDGFDLTFYLDHQKEIFAETKKALGELATQEKSVSVRKVGDIKLYEFRAANSTRLSVLLKDALNKDVLVAIDEKDRKGYKYVGVFLQENASGYINNQRYSIRYSDNHIIQDIARYEDIEPLKLDNSVIAHSAFGVKMGQKDQEIGKSIKPVYRSDDLRVGYVSFNPRYPINELVRYSARVSTESGACTVIGSSKGRSWTETVALFKGLLGALSGLHGNAEVDTNFRHRMSADWRLDGNKGNIKRASLTLSEVGRDSKGMYQVSIHYIFKNYEVCSNEFSEDYVKN